MTAWRWVSAQVVHAINDRQLADHGEPDVADLAATYAYGLALRECTKTKVANTALSRTIVAIALVADLQLILFNPAYFSSTREGV